MVKPKSCFCKKRKILIPLFQTADSSLASNSLPNLAHFLFWDKGEILMYRTYKEILNRDPLHDAKLLSVWVSTLARALISSCLLQVFYWDLHKFLYVNIFM